MNQLTGQIITKLMRSHHKTIKCVAASMNITQTRVRHVRENGIKGEHYVADWMEAITGDHKAGWSAIAKLYL